MPEGYPQPAPPDVISPQETGRSEGLGNLITSLVEQQTTSYENGDDDEEARYDSKETRVYNLLIDLRSSSPELWHDTIANVFTAYGSLIYDKLPISKQALFLWDSRNEQEERGADLVLTQEEGGILQNIAQSVGVEYDPGTAENAEQKTFKLADIEKKKPDRAKVPPEYLRWQFNKGKNY